jgi:2,3-diketo-5-methylthiopentyl-1-phosphate enolase
MQPTKSRTEKWDAVNALQVLAASDGLDQDKYVVATYYVETPSPDIVKYSAGVALQQTVGTWVRVQGETPSLMEEHGGRVTQIFKVPGTSQSYLIQIAYPTSNLTADFELLLATVMGEISWWVAESPAFATKLVDLQFPKSFLQEFSGPKSGLPGIREYLRVYDRPILNSMVKPCTGQPTEAHVETFREAAFGGVDHIKDDEVLGDIPINPLYERLSKCMEVVDQKKSETGEQTLYSINITTRSDRILEKAEKAVQAGANGLLLDSSAGFGPLRMLAEDPSIKVPILYHPCFNGAMVASERSGLSFPLLAKLVRIAGADAMVLYSYLGKIPSATKTGNQQVLGQATCPLQAKKAMGCLIAAGIHPGLVPLLLNDFGTEIIIGAGGAIHGHPEGSRAGARAMRQALDAAMKKKPLEEEAGSHAELRVALEKWGAPRNVDESKKLYALRG